MITTDRVLNASDHLDDVTKAMWVVWFRQSDVYRKNAVIFSADLVSRIDAAEGTVKARILNAIAKELDILGVGEVEIRGDRDAVWWNQEAERQALLNTAFLALYDDIVDGTGGTTIDGVIPSLGLYGDAAVGQRPQLTGIFGTAIKCCSGYPNCSCVTTYRVKSYPY